VTNRVYHFLIAAGCVAGLAPLSGPASATTHGGPLREMRCDLMDQYRGHTRTLEAPDIHVLDQTAAPGRFAPSMPTGVVGMMCARTSIVPAGYDDEVIALGVPFFIAETGSPGRLGVLEAIAGQYRFRMIRGNLAAEEQASVDQRLREYQGRLPAPRH
jgi:hypothetical protein